MRSRFSPATAKDDPGRVADSVETAFFELGQFAISRTGSLRRNPDVDPLRQTLFGDCELFQ